MSEDAHEWVYLYVNGFNYEQIAAIVGWHWSTVRRRIHQYIRSLGIPQLKHGKSQRMFGTANAGLILAYEQCGRCNTHRIKFIEEDGVKEAAVCLNADCGVETSLIPGAASLR